jgi:glycosyltransferase involved in cell wall biosynthesis
MNIAFLVVKNIARGGGIEKYTLELGRRLVKRGHKVTVYSMKHYGDVPSEYAGMRVIGLPCIKKAALEKLTMSASAALHLCFMRQKYDVVHCHSVAAAAYGFLMRLYGYKCVLQMHGIEWQRTRWSNFGKNFLKLLEALSVKGCQNHTAVSNTQCEHYRNNYGIDMRYIPTGAEVKAYRPVQEISSWGLQNGRYILFASRLVREKGAHYLIPAFKQINTEFNLVIAGDAKGEEEYKKELQDLADGDARILFPGFVEGRALEELFSNAAIYVQPSVIEGLSIALLEAMSYGNCCLVSDIPENQEAIGGCGFTFKSENILDLRDKMQILIADPALRSSVAEQARQRVAELYNWDMITEAFEEFYLQCRS